jgi:hypothetical protein
VEADATRPVYLIITGREGVKRRRTEFVFFEEATRMLIVCAWCSSEIGRHAGVETDDVSHGICLPCMFKQSPMAAVKYWIGKHPEDVAALAIALLAGVFLVWWLVYGVPPCAL